ncbi:MAG: VTT domain-containing protein [Bacteroidales bacterium]|nr:VTT domain-containing protein [Bacteroidales bacterium]
MKQLRIVIITFILVTVGIFIWLTAGTDAQSLLFERIVVTDQRIVFLVLLISVLTLLSTLSGLPILYLSMAIGFLLNFTPALLICWGVNVLAVMASFFMVRSAFTGYFREKYGEKKLIKRINKRIGKHGLWSVVVSRGVYIIPTNLINFSFPLSNITTRSYLLGTMIGLIPECLINVLTGYLIKHEVILLSTPETRTWQAAIIGAFILLLLLVFILLRIRQNRRKKFTTLKGIPFKS